MFLKCGRFIAWGECVLAVALSGISFSATAQTLSVTNGLQLWLEADVGVTTNADGLVTAWKDQSGQGNDATQSDSAQAPTLVAGALNGHAVLNFPGDTRFLNVADSPSIANLADDVTILTVARYDDLATYRCVVTKTLGNKPAPFDWWNNQSVNDGRTTFYMGDGTTANLAGYTSSSAPPVGVYNVMAFTWGSGVLDQYLNDTSNGHFTYTITLADGGTPLRIGSRDDQVTQLKGDVAEVLIYQPALSDADRKAVISYLQNKYALAFNQPPSVSIAAPADGATVAAPGPIPVNLDATDPDGSVARVDLVVNGTVFASWSQSPYQIDLGLQNPGTLALSAIAVDNDGLSATSAPVSITVTGTVPSAPATDGLKVWLRADAGVTTAAGGTVTTWTDQSGNGNDATQSDPASAPSLAANVIDGHPALHFAPTDSNPQQFLEVPDVGTAFTASDFSTFVVARFDNFSSYRVLWTKSSGGLAAPFDWWFSPNGGVPNVFRGDGFTYGGPVAGIHAAPVGQFATFGVTAGGTTVSQYLGFAANGAGTITNAPAGMGETLRIGSRDDGGTQMVGDIAEILIYDHALSDTDRSNAVSYLCSKYGLAQVFNANQPPVVSISSPADGAQFSAPTTVPFHVTASDPDGTVTRVDLFANGSLLTSETNSPYQISVELLTPGSVTLSAVAVDNWGVQTTSAPVVLTVSGNASSTPVTDGLALWLAADAGVTADSSGAVTEWDDQSGQGNNAYQPSAFNAPVLTANALNGKPALHFTSGPDPIYLQVDNAPSIGNLTTNFSAFVVAEATAYSDLPLGILSKTVINWPRPFDWLYSIAGGHTGQPELTLGYGQSDTGNILESFASQAPQTGQFYVLGVSVSGGTVNHYLNLDSNGSASLGFAPTDGGGPLYIGTRDDQATQMNGDIAEILVYNHTLSDTDRRQVLDYLSSKYGLTFVRVANLPPTVTVSGPADGSTAAVPAVLNVTGQVNDPDSAIDSVQLLANDNQIVLTSITNLQTSGSLSAAAFQFPLQALTPGTLTLQVRATDVFGAVGTSAPVVVTLSGSAPSAPPTSGMLLWLNAAAGVTTNADGTVASWADQSGQGNDASQADPSVAPLLGTDAETGQPVLEFDGSTRYLDVTSPGLTLGAEISSFFAGSFSDFGTYRAVWGKSSGNLPRPWDFYIAPGGTMTVYRGNNDGQTGISSASPIPAKRFLVGGFTAKGSLATLYSDGQVIGTGSFGYGALDAGTPLRIGSRDDLATQFAGNLGEVLIYDHALSAPDLQAVEAYLAGRYGLVLVQPSTLVQPTLSIQQTGTGTALISWPAGFENYVLEGQTTLSAGAWTPIATNPPNNEVSINATNVTEFFRLRSP